MFASTLAKAQTNAAKSPIRNVGSEHSLLAAQPSATRAGQAHRLSWSIGNQATLRRQRVGELGAGTSPASQMASRPASGPVPAVQFHLSRVPNPLSGGQVHNAARLGTNGTGSPLPYFDRIQKSFGRNSVAEAQAHIGANAGAACDAIGANAFTTAGHIAFAGTPNLRLAAHEAAHVVQQRSGLHLDGGVGRSGDRHEQHANAVADRVIRGESSEALLSQYAATGGSRGTAVQKDEKKKDEPPVPGNARKGEVRLKDDGGNITTEDDKEIRTEDPFEHSILIFNKEDKTWKRQMYTLVPDADGNMTKQMGPVEDISEARAKALKVMNQKTAPFAQETEAGAAARVASDDAILAAKQEAFDHKDEYPARLAKYQSDLADYKALPPDEKKKARQPQPPMAPPAVRPVNKSKTTKCVDWPAQVYTAAGVTSKGKITFGPPTTLNSWRTFDTNPEGPKAGDVYYIWDEVKKQAAHMGEFKSAVKIPPAEAGGKDTLQRWVVTDGGQGDGYEKVNFIYERQRIFDSADKHFYDKAADAGATTAGRRLEGWVDIDVQIADEAKARADKAAAAAPKSPAKADATKQ